MERGGVARLLKVTTHDGAVGDTDGQDIIDDFIDQYFKVEDDSIVMGMQLTVGTLLFLLHIAFEIVIALEIGAVMPPAPGGEIWDPRVHGMPWPYWLTGMPAMWFTSRKALKDLQYWVGLARQAVVHSIC